VIPAHESQEIDQSFRFVSSFLVKSSMPL
jgi:hypothetical protein